MTDSAQAALDAVQRDPRAAIALAERALAAARSARDADEEATAERAIGLALRELNDTEQALRRLRRAVLVADRAGSPRVAALTRLSLAYVLSSAGSNARALRALDAALPHLRGVDAGRARMQRGAVLHFSGRHDEAARDYTAAVESARRHGDRLGEAKALNNRGLLRAYRGAARGAERDFDRAAELFAHLGLQLAAADVRFNSGIVAAQRSDVPLALAVFAEAEEEFRRLDVPRPELWLDRLELLLSVPLVDEAGELAAAAVDELRRRGMASDLAEGLLARARAGLLAGDHAAAAAAAAEAREMFRRQGRLSWETLARHVELRADVLRGDRTPRLLAALRRAAAALDEVGWSGPALTARLEAAQVARDLGDTGEVRAELAAARAARRGGTAAQRAQGWYAEALLRGLDGDGRGAERALRRGLAVLDDYRATLGATELRAATGAHGEALAREGLAGALARGHPAQVLAWAERWRAGALRTTRVHPPEDPRLDAALTELRAVSADLEQALLAGEPAAALRRRQRHLEQEIRDVARQAAGRGGAAPARPPTVRDVAERLGDAALVELVAHGGRLAAVVVAGGRASLHDLGDGAEAGRELDQLRFGLRRLATPRGRARVREAATLTTTEAARRLDERLLAPLRPRLRDRPLVVVPTGALHAVPWSVLPGCRGRPVTAAPSAAVWSRAATGAEPVGPVVLAAGPGLPAARAEVVALGRALPHARVLLDGAATAAAVGSALDGASLAHVAAHGTFRADHPLFSALQLADGPLTVYDLERLRRPPGRIVLSACDSGLPVVRPGDELMGLAAALLGLGTRTLVATVVPVPDEATAPLMADLHRRLRAGTPPAEALAEAQETYLAGNDDLALAASAGFVCFGAG